MKRTFTFIVSLLLFTTLIAAGGCTKAEEPKKSDIEVAIPATPPPAEPPAAIAEKPKTSPDKATPSAKPVRPAPPSAPVAPAVAPETPATPAAPAVKDIVLVAGFDSPQMQKGAPAGWKLDRKKGTPSLNLEKGSDTYYLHMQSNNESSFGVKRGIKVDIKEYPYLNWKWKVDRLPDGGDVRKSDKDDQAIQLYVAFTPTGFPEVLNTPVLGYIWDSEAPKGLTGRSVQIGGGKLRYVVVRNNTDTLGQWYTEKRNIYEDYKKLLKDVKSSDPPGITHGVQFHINSQKTNSAAESYIHEVYFSKN
jgi:hypothetical protein